MEEYGPIQMLIIYFKYTLVAVTLSLLTFEICQTSQGALNCTAR